MTLLGGRYRTGELIGRGGSADVHVAVDELLDRRVAVKILREPADVGLWAGVRAAAGLRHPHIVATLDAGTDPAGRPYVVLDLVDGITLEQLLTRDGPPGARASLTILDGVLAALAHAHAHGVLHLDLSPANVMVPVVDGRPRPAEAVVLDLGSTRAPERGDRLVTVSPDLAAPEIATASGADERSDVYSAGALLFLLLTGRPPFVRDAAPEVLLAHVDAPVPRVPGASPAVDRLVTRALAKDPGGRFASASAMRAAVAAAVAGAPASTTAPRRPYLPGTTRPLPVVAPTGAPRAAGPGVARRRSATPVVVTLLLAAAIVGGIALAHPSADVARGAPPVPVPAPSTSVPTPTPTVRAPVPAPSAPADPTTAVPELVGLDLDAARIALAVAGLVVGDLARSDGPSPPGTVLAIDPVDGSRVPPGSAVGLVVASGVVEVPAVAGLLRKDALAALGAAGLVATERDVPSGRAGAIPGLALGTQPAGGAPAVVGAAVLLFVGAPAATPAPTPTPTPMPTPSAAEPAPTP